MAKVFGASVVRILTFFLIIYNFYICASTPVEESDTNTSSDFKNHYHSVEANATSVKQQPSAITPDSNGTERAASETSIVVPYNRPLLGVNGTGQRKDITEKAKATVVSEPIQSGNGGEAAAGAAGVTTKKANQFPKKALGVSVPLGISDGRQSAEESEEDKFIDSVDVPENETINALQNQNLTVNQTTDHHNYYNSTIYVSKAEAEQIWSSIKDITPNMMLSQSHRRAMTVVLSFDFPFYGHPVRNVTVATGGFIYTGDYVHSWLAATQYIAPLMANFDTSLSNDSFVRLNDTGSSFTVIWENVYLQDKQDVGKFTFSTTLHKNGDIVFTYFTVPIFVNAIQDDKHPVKVGLSDAYIIDKVVYFARRKTIYEYHRVNFANSEITNSTIIYLKALPSCLQYTDCVSCINHETSFDCAWCPLLNRCSTGTDRKKQEWLAKGCDRAQITDASTCPAIGQKGNNANQTSDSPPFSPPTSSNNNGNRDEQLRPFKPVNTNSMESSTTLSPSDTSNPISKEIKAVIDEPTESKSMGLTLGFIVPICLVIVVLLWVLYAYRNPHTKSGQLLIQYRPSQWTWRRGEARYTAATIHM